MVLRICDLVLDVGERLASRLTRFTLGEDPPNPLKKRAEWASKPFWTLWRGKGYATAAGNPPAIFSVVQHIPLFTCPH